MKNNESYPKDWAHIALMVSPTGEMHAVEGDQEPGDPLADRPYIGLERIKAAAAKKESERLMTLCTDFVREHKITNVYQISDSDEVIVSAYKLIEEICNIVGYHPSED